LDRKDIPKLRIIPTILGRVITHKTYTISFIATKDLNQMCEILYLQRKGKQIFLIMSEFGVLIKIYILSRGVKLKSIEV